MPASSIRKVVGANVRRYRLAADGGKGWSQLKLSVRAGIHENWVGRIERGEQGVTIDVLAKIAKALGIEPHLLMVPLEDRGKR